MGERSTGVLPQTEQVHYIRLYILDTGLERCLCIEHTDNRRALFLWGCWLKLYHATCEQQKNSKPTPSWGEKHEVTIVQRSVPSVRPNPMITCHQALGRRAALPSDNSALNPVTVCPVWRIGLGGRCIASETGATCAQKGSRSLLQEREALFRLFFVNTSTLSHCTYKPRNSNFFKSQISSLVYKHFRNQ